MANGKINKNPDFFRMAAKLKKDLQIDAEKKGLDFIYKNFYEEGFFDSSFEPWPQRQEPRSYNLLRVTNTLFNSIRATSQDERVIFSADAPYAAIHNEGGVIRVNVTNKMRKFFLAMYRSTGEQKWKWMALTKKEQLTIKIPQRKFMGDSEQFKAQLDRHAVKEILRRFKGL